MTPSCEMIYHEEHTLLEQSPILGLCIGAEKNFVKWTRTTFYVLIDEYMIISKGNTKQAGK